METLNRRKVEIGIVETRKNLRWMEVMVTLSVTAAERIKWEQSIERTKRLLRFLETSLEIFPERAEKKPERGTSSAGL